MRSRTILAHLSTILLVVGLVIGSAVSSVQAKQVEANQVEGRQYYANQTPYGDPVSSTVASPPNGYELFFVETIARHGARSSTDAVAEKRALAVWAAASRQNKLTTRGKRFDNDLRRFQKSEKSIGYGRLSNLGKAEWRGIGRRTAESYRGFLTESAAAGDKILMVTSPVYRTKQSASAMRSGLRATTPGLRFGSSRVDQDFLISEGSTAAGRAAISTVKRRTKVRAAARNILLRLYRPSYVKRLNDPVDKALDLYRLYATAPGMRGQTSVTFADYVPSKEARVMAEVMDARNFYRYGPGVAGQRRSYQQAEPVLASFFTQLDKRMAGGHTSAVFRHAHGEVTMPFAALIKAPGSTRGASKKAPYSYGRNAWRGELAGRLAGSLEWAAYRNADGKVLVTMRYNEKPAVFSQRCKPSSIDRRFYSVAELKRCLR